MLDAFKKYLRGLKKPGDLPPRLATPTPYGVRQAAFSSVVRGLEPAKVAGIMAAALQGDASRWFALAEEMEERYPHYAAQIATRKRALAGLPLRVEAVSTEPRDIEIAAFVSENLPAIRAALFDMADAIAKGISVMELEWQAVGGRWRIAALTRVDPRWLRFDPVDLATPLLASDAFPEGEPLEAGRFFTLTLPQKSGLAVRGGIAWCAVWPFLFQNFSLKDWVTFVERFGKPIRLGVYEAGVASEADVEVLTEAVAAIGQDMGAVISSNLKLEFPQAAGGNGSGAWPELLRYLDNQVSKLIIGQTLSADSGNTGLGSGVAGLQGDVRRDILLADAAMVETALSTTLIPLLTQVNFGDAPCPAVTLDTTQEEDLSARMSIVKTAVELGFKVSTSWFSDTFKIPLAEDGESVLVPGVQGDQGSGDRGQVSVPSAHRAESNGDTRAVAAAQAELDLLADAALSDWQPQMDACLFPVLAAINEAAENGDTAETILARLPRLLEQMDSGLLEKRLAKAMMVAQAGGTAL
ncbi:Mu-like prophage FluMu protein gp29 [Betaproteobacteria bacterium]|nr:Mu-like prophage FluMu protein gp29 [Betaproteobacteria bacterium]